MPTSFDNEVNILIGGLAPNHALRSALGTDHLIFEYEFFFQHHYLQEFFHQNKSLQESLCSEWCHNKTWSTDFTHSFRRLAVSFIVYCSRYVGRLSFDWQWIKSISCLANHALPSALGADHLILVEELGQFILSLNLLLTASLFAKNFFTKISLCRNFFYHSMLFYYTKKKNPCAQSGLNQYWKK